MLVKLSNELDYPQPSFHPLTSTPVNTIELSIERIIKKKSLTLPKKKSPDRYSEMGRPVISLCVWILARLLKALEPRRFY